MGNKQLGFENWFLQDLEGLMWRDRRCGGFDQGNVIPEMTVLLLEVAMTKFSPAKSFSIAATTIHILILENKLILYNHNVHVVDFLNSSCDILVKVPVFAYAY